MEAKAMALNILADPDFAETALKKIPIREHP
jgi:hypothetical protein